MQSWLFQFWHKNMLFFCCYKATLLRNLFLGIAGKQWCQNEAEDSFFHIMPWNAHLNSLKIRFWQNFPEAFLINKLALLLWWHMDMIRWWTWYQNWAYWLKSSKMQFNTCFLCKGSHICLYEGVCHLVYLFWVTPNLYSKCEITNLALGVSLSL